MINSARVQLEKEIVSIFKKYSSGNPPKINLDDAFSCIQNSTLLPADVKKQQLIEEFYLRQYDVKFSFLCNILSQHGGRKMSCNPPGGLDAQEYIGMLSEDDFKNLALGMHFSFKFKAKDL